MNPLIPKARKPRFEAHLTIVDLNNVPLVSGVSYVKWHLPSSIAAEHRGRTPKAPIREHKVVWDSTHIIPVRLTIDKNNQLAECLIYFEIIQDYSGSGVKGEKITLGHITLNLAEYVEESEALVEGEEGITRRYLMQDSKVNSTLKLTIFMKQIDGERNFIAPPLKTAAVFGGIAGIMAGEGEEGDLGYTPSITKSRDASELQDMYRRALAASWAIQQGELPPDECVEDIFAGGDGWKHDSDAATTTTGGGLEDGSNGSTEDISRQKGARPHHHRMGSDKSTDSKSTLAGKSSSPDLRYRHARNRYEPVAGPGIPSDSYERGRKGYLRNMPEVSEFDVRSDLVAWELPSAVHV
ncbi:N-terminal C2 in EEIG1 and EHBP1 proteins-domain-containing protein [Xylogone sp. PMI_703]|nr:N-terminal C2 in EEIG1 and EHBP1 proteins-domain-containing protein [Xylogone sp. PMI_703]